MNTNALVIIIATVGLVAAVLFFVLRARSQKSGKTAESIQGADHPESLVEAPVSQSVTSNSSKKSAADDFGKSRGSLTSIFRSVFNRSAIDEDAWQELEDALIMADMGAQAASEFVAGLKRIVRSENISNADELFNLARTELVKVVDGGLDRTLQLTRSQTIPAVVLTVGVNGTGKTTTTGKLAKFISNQDKEVLLGAADTFRAAAADQLATWGDRVGALVVRGAEGSDPGSVAFDAVTKGYEQEVDVVLIDTAGRLHTKQGLMDELGKVYRVCAKRGPIAEVLLVIDATTGQNGLIQAKVFSEVVPVTGVVLSKLDGTAKGGIVVAVQQELGVPVKLVGLGEGPDDLAVFEPAEFVAGLLA
ncbi:MAG: signal recognition particle-docking protein FtsY [Actinobacteria bacterium]|nr:signal recognition particle-docking protein FtsY [Actinomycetota bacterium]NBY14907.1 signal recognition particle-docking protein FtsY [Actinomycetota bacterium]